MTCQLCENRPATLDHLAEGKHFLICEECYIPNGCPPRAIGDLGEVRCLWCNRPWRLRRQACPVHPGEPRIEHEFVIPQPILEAALEATS